MYIPGRGDIVSMEYDVSPEYEREAAGEQSGRRMAIVISSRSFNRIARLAIVCPVTGTDNGFPTHVPLSGTDTRGIVLCEHIKSLYYAGRRVKRVETAPKELVETIIAYINAVLEDVPETE